MTLSSAVICVRICVFNYAIPQVENGCWVIDSDLTKSGLPFAFENEQRLPFSLCIQCAEGIVRIALAYRCQPIYLRLLVSNHPPPKIAAMVMLWWWEEEYWFGGRIGSGTVFSSCSHKW